MSEKEMAMYDAEVFSMVNNARRDRVVVALVPMEKLHEVETFDRRLHQMKHVGSVAVPLCIGLTAVGALARNMMSPGLTICVLGACVIWAAVNYWRGGNG